MADGLEQPSSELISSHWLDANEPSTNTAMSEGPFSSFEDSEAAGEPQSSFSDRGGPDVDPSMQGSEGSLSTSSSFKTAHDSSSSFVTANEDEAEQAEIQPLKDCGGDHFITKGSGHNAS